MTRRLVLATRNAHKVEELRRILDAAGLDVELLGSEAFADMPDVAETGVTFADNALLKARAVAEATGLPAVGDDSGLCVDALNGMPGVLSARWAGEHATDQRNLDLLLDQVAEVPDSRLGARFVCAAALALPDGRTCVAEGEVRGGLVRQPRGTNGFGYDPAFVPEGETRTTAEMPSDEKDAISHRGRAFRALAPVVGEMLG
ncbi:MAG: RdgB/HAM1 family non-canonical purine NTP pyrophosphatase [Actinomycetes bacterium]